MEGIMTAVQLVAFVLGMALGAGLIATCCVVYVKNRHFGVGEIGMISVGTILVGLSIFSSFNLSVSPQGQFTFQAQIYNAVRDASRTYFRDASTGNAPPISTDQTQTTSTPSSVELLKNREKEQQLIDQKDYQAAMKLDPKNVIPVMYFIEQSVERGDYSKALDYVGVLRQDNDSGVGYSAYPYIALAYERTGSDAGAGSILLELHNRIATDIAHGFGYLSSSQTLGWIRKDLDVTVALVRSKAVKDQVADLQAYIDKTVSMLKG
jgi:hypothetical protein